MADKIKVELTPEQLQAVNDLVGERVSEVERAEGTANQRDTPLWQAERELDGALMAWEEEQHTAPMLDDELLAYALAHTYATHEFSDPADEHRMYELLLAQGDLIGVEIPEGDEYQRAVLHHLDPERVPDFPINPQPEN